MLGLSVETFRFSFIVGALMLKKRLWVAAAFWGCPECRVQETPGLGRMLEQIDMVLDHWEHSLESEWSSSVLTGVKVLGQLWLVYPQSRWSPSLLCPYLLGDLGAGHCYVLEIAVCQGIFEHLKCHIQQVSEVPEDHLSIKSVFE